MIRRWVDLTPPGFLFAVKAWRAITHERRLVDCGEPLALFLERIAPLGGRQGPILFQLPPRFPADPARLAAFLARLPPDGRHAFEFRDPSWWTEAVQELLAAHGAAFVVFDHAGLRSPRLATAGLVYARLHGYAERYRGRYPMAVLEDWSRWLSAQRQAGHEVLAYLDNTMLADDALQDARSLGAMLAGVPGPPT